jgi:retinol dehydrogenase-14
MPALRDRIALVTGATSGIGLEAAVALARRGAEVVLVGRDSQRLAGAVDRVRRQAGVAARSYRCDFASLADVRRLVDAVRRDLPRIDILINNAGGVHKRRTVTVDGHEATFATNHLAHFLLTTRLLDRIVASAPARVITVASIGHRRGTMDFGDLGFERGYGIMRAYSRSKLANVLFAKELARRLAGTGVTSNSVHPGAVATNIWAGAPLWAKPLIWAWLRPRFISAEQGGETVVRLAVSATLECVSGRYFEGHDDVAPAPLAEDADLAKRLWDVSERLVGA